MPVSTKLLKAVAQAASKEPGRYAIAGVLVSRRRVEATNGRMLVSVRVEGAASDDERRILPHSSLKALPDAELLFGPSANAGTTEWDGGLNTSGTVPIVDAVFPNTSEVITKRLGEKRAEVKVNVGLLLQFVRSLAATAKAEDVEHVTLSIPTENGDGATYLLAVHGDEGSEPPLSGMLIGLVTA